SDLSEVVADRGSILVSPTGIEIRGPGRLLVRAGRDVNLGHARVGDLGGLIATGNTRNASIQSPSDARITIIAGVSGNLDPSGLDARYAQLIDAGKNHDTTLAADAAAVLFAGTRINRGDINSYLTSIQTYQGAGIDLLAPAGNITVGLTTPSQGAVGVITNAG